MSVSSAPMQCNDVGQLPWIEFEENQIDDDLIEDEGIAISFAPQHEDLAQAHINLILSDLAEEEVNDEWTAVTFGLGLVDLGRRDVTFDPGDLNQMLRQILDTWIDHAQYGGLTIYHVNPQPMDLAGKNPLFSLLWLRRRQQMIHKQDTC